MTESRHASYCNYRYLPEMLSAGILDDETVRRIVDYRRARGGEVLGMTRFGDHLDDWPEWHLAMGLLQTGDVAGYLMTFYGHLAHHQSRGNWASYEQVFIEPRQFAHRTVSGRAEQVVPCQVMAPLMLRHMLVYENWDEDTLYLLRACPGAWLASPEGISAEGIPTRWGDVSLGTHFSEGRLLMTAEIAGDDWTVPARIDVRVAIPGRQVKAVLLDSVPTQTVDQETSVVTVHEVKGGWFELVVEYD